jgi:cytochrome oxidase Cu insertion factor (SCO1/SenC/PrrC family)
MGGRMSWNRARIAGLVAAVAAAAAAGGIAVASRAGGSGPARSAAPVSVAPAAGVVRAGDMAPEFAGTATDGSRVDLAQLRGRVVLLSFFASWCSNCREDLPRVQAAGLGNASRGLTVLPVSYLETGDAAAFLRSIGVTVPSLIDATDAIG